MANINFPNNPAQDDIFTVGGKTYTYDGVKWVANTTITKTDVGLENVQNYGVASQAEAEAGTLDNKYMTPLKTAQAIAALESDTATEYAAGVVEKNDNSNLKFWKGTQSEFDALTTEVQLYLNEVTGDPTVVDIAPLTFDDVKDDLKITNASTIVYENGTYESGWSVDGTAPVGSFSITDGTEGIYIVAGSGTNIEIYNTGQSFPGPFWGIYYVPSADPNTEYIITDVIASQAEAEAGNLNNKYMTPLRTAQAIAELSPPTDVSTEYAAGVIEINNDNNLKFWQGTQAEYDALSATYTKTSGFTSNTTYDSGIIFPNLNSVNLTFTNESGETSTITNGVFSGFGGMTYDDATKTVTINTGDGVGFTLHLAGSSPYTNSLRGYTTGGVPGTFYYYDLGFSITTLTITLEADPNTLYFITEV